MLDVFEKVEGEKYTGHCNILYLLMLMLILVKSFWGFYHCKVGAADCRFTQTFSHLSFTT